ncbi:flagellar basal body rod protein FlgB [Candidatus Sumerlaeota bacterium]|nr:flagellar basal body rod protein FlgB [Candidatus Sumerlaeota bacterium]
MIEKIFGRTEQIVEKAMSLRMVRQGFIASNLANAETPGYRAVDVDFKATMAELVGKIDHAERAGRLEIVQTDPRHLAEEGSVSDELKTERIHFAAADDVSIGNDSNSVNREQELARLQMNTTMYLTLLQLLTNKLSGLKNVIDSSSKV